MTYEEFKTKNASLDQRMKDAKLSLDQWKGERLPNGLTPDRIRALPQWRAAKIEFDIAFQASRKFNGLWASKFKRQIQADIDAKRAAILATVHTC